MKGHFLQAPRMLAGLMLSLAIAAAVLAAEPTTEKAAETRLRVGTFDSRAVAVAYCGSDRHEAEARRLDEALKKAKKQGDAEQIKKADRAVWEARFLMHRQGFGIWPIDNILKQFPEAVERIEKEVDVTALVSKWDGNALAKYEAAEKVDVTERLIDAMKPNKRQRRHAMRILKVKPLGPKELEKMLKEEADEHYLSPPRRENREP